MQPSKMQLENYFVEEAYFSLQSEQIQNTEDLAILTSEDLEIEVELGEGKDNSFKRFCQLTVTLKEKAAETFPYKFKIQMVGFFNLDSTASAKELDMLMTNGAPSMLYTAAREYLLLITGRTRFLPLMLPTVFFTPKVKTEKAKNEERKKTVASEESKSNGATKKKPTKKTDNK